MRALEAHTTSGLVEGNRAEVLVSIGSANLDNRSFALNNELNLAFLDRRLARRLIRVFEQDLAFAQPVRYEDWERRGLSHLFSVPLLPLRDQL